MPGRDENTKPRRINERQLLEIKHYPNSLACLSLSQRSLQAGTLE
jgi:hypothetical protein